MNKNMIIDNSWTLFLDRDGVINEEILGSYVTSKEEFRFLEGVERSMNALSKLFGTIVVVTNQRGVGREIMTLDTLKEINAHMITGIMQAGGRIDKVYNATSLHDNDHNRKPNTGMGLQAKEDFEHIDFKHSIMVGNSMSDMEFGKRLGMRTVFLNTKVAPLPLPHDLIDEQYPSLMAWEQSLESVMV
jgi:D-glycero-D-manno-heptose 1,7-bisphosphate phosphatase